MQMIFRPLIGTRKFIWLCPDPGSENAELAQGLGMLLEL